MCLSLQHGGLSMLMSSVAWGYLILHTSINYYRHSNPVHALKSAAISHTIQSVRFICNQILLNEDEEREETAKKSKRGNTIPMKYSINSYALHVAQTNIKLIASANSDSPVIKYNKWQQKLYDSSRYLYSCIRHYSYSRPYR